MKKSLSQKILSAIENNRLDLTPGKKLWHGYILNIQKLLWARNLRDGYEIHVHDGSGYFLETIKL